MGTTTNGLPYPEPTEPVAEGANAIKALALALPSNRVITVVASDTIAVTDLPTAWPDGLSTAYYTTSGAGGAWPFRPCQVVTLRRGGTPVAQWVIPHTTTQPRILFRAGSASSNAWSPWVGGTAPYGQWAGQFTVSALVYGDSKDTTLTFPTGRFNRAPACSGIIGSPRYGYQIMTRSGSSVTIRCSNYSGGDASSSTTVDVGFTQATDLSNVGFEAHDESADYWVWVMCPTEGCPQQGQPLNLNIGYIDPDTGLPTTSGEIQCGGCGTILIPSETEPVPEPEPEPTPHLDKEAEA